MPRPGGWTEIRRHLGLPPSVLPLQDLLEQSCAEVPIISGNPFEDIAAGNGAPERTGFAGRQVEGDLSLKLRMTSSRLHLRASTSRIR
jgi:hypothetical protein